ncbi:MAG: hypothetical protein HY512_00950 [Candidatus Aenigmarchaeota archaeon]|nr:hypothetical protein [Candidatus Aenigmarchaeota archaeon]
MMHVELLARITCDHITGDKVYELVKDHHLQTDTIFSTKRVLEIGIDMEKRCTECRGLLKSISEVKENDI